MVRGDDSTLVFAFVGEGSSDDPLVQILRQLVTNSGAGSARGVPRRYGGSSGDKMRELVRQGAEDFDIVFLHRDADSEDHGPRRREVEQALGAYGLIGVPVIPVQETEAWLLVDEQAIRDVVGRSHGRVRLNLPGIRAIERARSPKEDLMVACLTASEASGRRREKEKREFGRYRRELLERLDPDGPVSELESFRRLVADTRQAVASAIDRQKGQGRVERPM